MRGEGGSHTKLVILAFESEKSAARIREVIETAGLASCLVCRSAAEVKRMVGKRRVTAMVCGHKLRDETAESLFDDLPPWCSMLVIAMQSLLDLIGGDGIFKLAAPVSRSELLSAVETLLQAGRRYEAPQRSDRERAVLKEAKGLLMDRHGMTEEEAHRFLQKKSMDSGSKLLQAAQMVIDGLCN